VVDTTGAGDAFAAGLLASWLAGRPLPDAVRAGAVVAARAVTHVGAQPG
jgi:sugar/nucleoside kinase (ribokinase family)